jgi:hypothetical protein
MEVLFFFDMTWAVPIARPMPLLAPVTAATRLYAISRSYNGTKSRLVDLPAEECPNSVNHTKLLTIIQTRNSTSYLLRKASSRQRSMQCTYSRPSQPILWPWNISLTVYLKPSSALLASNAIPSSKFFQLGLFQSLNLQAVVIVPVEDFLCAP